MTTVTEAGRGELNVDEQIGLGVHMRMYRARITQKVLAAELGIQQSAVSRKLRGARPWLAAELIVVARLLDVAPGDLLSDLDEPAPRGDGPSPAGGRGGPTSEASIDRYSTGSATSVVRHVQFSGPYAPRRAS